MPQYGYTPMEMIPHGSGLQPHSFFLRCTLAPPGDGFGGAEGHPHTKGCKRMAGRHLGRSFNGNFQDNKRQKGFEGSSLMLLWGLSMQPPHPRGPLLLWDSIRPEAGLSPLLQALLSPSSSSSLLKKSLPFPSLSRNPPCSFHIPSPSFLQSCRPCSPKAQPLPGAGCRVDRAAAIT